MADWKGDLGDSSGGHSPPTLPTFPVKSSSATYGVKKARKEEKWDLLNVDETNRQRVRGNINIFPYKITIVICQLIRDYEIDD